MKNKSIENFTTLIPSPTTSILNKQGYFNRHFLLCRFLKTQQDAYEQVEEEYKKFATDLKLDRKIMFVSYDSFRNAKSNYYANSNNR